MSRTANRRQQLLEFLPFAVIALIALGLRLWDLGARPLHHDESLHAFYAFEIYARWDYQYTPFLHGPVLYYLTALFYGFLGDGEFTARLGPALAGTLLCLLPWFLRRHLGKLGALAAAALLATSPTFFYFSRFLRHDIYSELLHAIMLVGALDYAERGKKWGVIAMPLCMTLGFANHELAYITAFLLVVYATAILYRHSAWKQVREFFRREKRVLWQAFAYSVAAFALLFSSFFSNLHGILDGLPNPFSATTSLGYWLSQHGVKRGSQPAYYYLLLLLAYEFVPLLLGMWALRRRRELCRDPVRAFLLYWCGGSLLIYSWAGERMPWLLMHPLLPLLLLAGYEFGRLWEKRRFIIVAVCGALFVLSGWFALRLNYKNGADPREMLVYVQSSPDVIQVANKIKQYDVAHAGARILIDNKLTWPFAWYLRRQNIVAYPRELRYDLRGPTLQNDILLIHMPSREETPTLPSDWHEIALYNLRTWWRPDQAGFNPLRLDGWRRMLHWWWTRDNNDGYGSMFFRMYYKQLAGD